MNKLIVALIAGVFAAAVGAQTPAPAAESTVKKLTTNPKAAEVGAVTKQESNINTGATDAKNQAAATAKSKQDPKALKTNKEKEAAVAATTTAGSTTSTGATTAAQQKANVEKSKKASKSSKTTAAPAPAAPAPTK